METRTKISLVLMAFGLALILASNLFYFVIGINPGPSNSIASGTENSSSCASFNASGAKSAGAGLSVSRSEPASGCTGQLNRIENSVVYTSITMETAGFVLIAAGIAYYILGVRQKNEASR